MQAIEAHSLTKIYQTIPATGKAYARARKEQGPGLWIKKLFKLRSQQNREVRALDSVSFSVNTGEVFGIVGPNGAGKTTLIKILSGLLYPTSGTAKIMGFDLLKAHDLVKDRIAYVSTSGWMGLEWQLTVYENLLFYADLMRIPRKKARDKIDELMADLKMADYASKTIPQLSAGMREMLTLARGLLVNRPIIYLDEPTTSLDPFARERFWKYILKNLNEHAVIFSSHDPAEIEKYADRLMFLKAGRILEISRPADLLKRVSDLKIYQMELSYAKELPLNEFINVMDSVWISDRRVKMRFVLKSSLNELVNFLVSNEAVIHSISKDLPKISDVYLRMIEDEKTME